MKRQFISMFVLLLALLVSPNLHAEDPIDPYLSQPLTFVAEDETTVYLGKASSPTSSFANLFLQYSTDGEEWVGFGAQTDATKLTIPAGTKMMLRRDPAKTVNASGFGNTSSSYYDSRYYYFVTTGSFSLEGNIMSLVDGANYITNQTIPAVCCFGYLFKENTALTSVENLRLPATTLKNRAYRGLFLGCSNLTTIPTLTISGDVAERGLYQMFSGCASLTAVGDITIDGAVGTSGCQLMFQNCSGLASVGDITVTGSVGTNGLYQMFSGCTSLTAVGNLTIGGGVGTDGCRLMFQNCSSLAASGDIDIAGSVGNNGLTQMYDACNNLEQLPNVTIGSIAGNSTTTAAGCYRMFYNLQGATSAGSLTINGNIGQNSCRQMYESCSNLATVGDVTINGSVEKLGVCLMYNSCPLTKLPNVTMGTVIAGTSSSYNNGGCYRMFYGIATATEAGSITLGTVGTWGCKEMFTGCTGLTSVGDITINGNVNDNGMYRMFLNMTNLQAAPTLTITGNITTNACREMFSGCTSLAEAGDINIGGSVGNNALTQIYNASVLSELPNVTIGSISGSTTSSSPGCYRMFYNLSTATKAGAFTITNAVGQYGCFKLYEGCSNLASVGDVSVGGNVGVDGLYYMFYGCPALTSVGDITVGGSVSDYGMTQMFEGCSNLAKLPNVTIGTINGSSTSTKAGCYHMFYNLKGATEAGALTITGNVGVNGCRLMYEGCSNLTSVGDIQVAGTLNTNGFTQIYNGATQITHLPSVSIGSMINAASGTGGCYRMFYGLNGATEAGEITIDADAIGNYGLQNMYEGCTTLVDIPSEFSYATIGVYGCHQMYLNCSSLTQAPSVSATTIGNNGCQLMFSGCTGLTSVGDIAVTETVGTNAFTQIYNGATQITHLPSVSIGSMADGASGTGSCYRMFYNLTGATEAGEITIGDSRIGNFGFQQMYEGCTALVDIPSAFSYATIGNYGYQQMYLNCSSLTQAPSISATTIGNNGCQLMFKGCTSLTSVGDIAVTETVGTNAFTQIYDGATQITHLPSVSIGSMADGASGTGSCYRMFYNLTGATEAGTLTISNDLGHYGCQQMYEGCSALATVQPQLTFQNVGNSGCYQMYLGCKSLSQAPSITATSIGNNGCQLMFNGCYDATNETGIASAGDITVSESVAPNGMTQMYNGCLLLTKTPNLSVKEILASTSAATGGCYQMFSGLQGLTTAGELSLNTIGNYGCYQMFYNCQNLQAAPSVETDSIGVSGCQYMFQNNYKLESAGDIVVHGGVGLNGCTYMFGGCSILSKSPALTANTIWGTAAGNGGCYRMFYNLSGLTGAGSIAVGRIMNYGCERMFESCVALSSLDDVTIRATNISPYCYSYMFNGCINLTGISGLSLETEEMADFSHQYMFNGCTGLQDVETFTLPSTKLANNCYQYMFNACTGLTTIEDIVLPATDLKPRCYYNMFQGCTNLETAMPEISVNTIAEQSCYQMFLNCKALTASPAIVADSVGYYGCFEMFKGCYTGADRGLQTLGEINVRKVDVRGMAGMFENCYRLSEIPSALTMEAVEDYGFYRMFYNCTTLVSAPTLAINSLGNYTCQYMYYNCSKLENMPGLPTMEIGNYCYSRMFEKCVALQNITSLPATKLTEGCYEYMFNGCAALTVAPALPVTKLAKNCYKGMFYACSRLEKAPVLPAAKLESGCYQEMFYNCAALNYIKVGFNDWRYIDGMADNPTTNWVYGVKTTAGWGTFYCLPTLTQQRDIHHIPVGWNIQPTSEQMLVFNANGGKWVDGTTEDVQISQAEISQIPHPVRDGSMFVKWNTQPDGGGEDLDITNLPDVETTYYACYEAIGVSLQKWQSNALVLSITNKPATMETAVTQVVGGKSTKSTTLSFSQIDRGAYQIAINKTDLTSHYGGTLNVTLMDEDDNVLGTVSLQIPFMIESSVLASSLGETENADIWLLNGATLTLDVDLACDAVYVGAGAKLVVPAAKTLTTNTLTLRGGDLANGTYLFDYPQVVVNGSVQNASGVVNYQYLTGLQQNYALALPADVNIADVTYMDGTAATFGVYQYNGEWRAGGKSGWEEIWDPTAPAAEVPTLLAGRGYTIYAVPEKVNGNYRNYCYLNFPMEMDLTSGEVPVGSDKTVNVTTYGFTDGELNPGVAANNAGWNFVGDPYLANFISTDESGFESGKIGELVLNEETGQYEWVGDARYVVLPSNNGQSYTTALVREATLPSFKNFFIQVANGDQLSFASAHRAQSIPARMLAAQEEDEQMIGLRLSGNNMTDRMGILLGDQFSKEYEFNADLDKWGNSTMNLYARVGQYNLAMAALNFDDAKSIPLGVTVSAKATYTFTIDDSWTTSTSDLKHLYLQDVEAGTLTDLLLEDYSCTIAPQSASLGRFRLIAQRNDVVTANPDVDMQRPAITATANGLQLQGLTDAEVHIYTMTGIELYHGLHTGDVSLPLNTGTYVVSIQQDDFTYSEHILVY